MSNFNELVIIVMIIDYSTLIWIFG